mmetsp:Transcript_5230/g.17365  ORF Transcript_5230/g.17365 Transcript_5230/m.17365 type:complete len:231 (+) Transcript_5230:171-863(+)
MQPVLHVPSFSLARSQAECAAITRWVLASARLAQIDVGGVWGCAAVTQYAVALPEWVYPTMAPSPKQDPADVMVLWYVLPAMTASWGGVQKKNTGRDADCQLGWCSKTPVGMRAPQAQLSIYLTTEAIQGAALALEGVHHVHGGDGLAAGMLGVGDHVTDHVLKEHLEDTARLLVDEAGDALDATTAGQAADSRLGDALDVVAEHLAVALGAALSESLASLAASRHIFLW